jgi:primary-amine oxidase
VFLPNTDGPIFGCIGISDYTPRRTWSIANTNKLNEYSKLPVSYSIVSREVPGLLPVEGSLVWNRAGFARHALHVTVYSDDERYPAGRHVPQHSGEPSQGKILPKTS